MELDKFIEILEKSEITDRIHLMDRHYENVIRKNKFPFIKNNSVTFIYNGKAKKVNLKLDAGFETLNDMDMKNIKGTDLFYITKEFDLRTKMRYWFDLSDELIHDENNKSVLDGSLISEKASLLKMPAHNHPETEFYSDIAHGQLVKIKFINNTIFGNKKDERKITIYLPDSYSSDNDYKTIYFLDGTEYLEKASLGNTLDYLINFGILEPIIAVFIDPIERTREYRSVDRDYFLDYIVKEIIPYVEKEYSAISNRESRVLVGPSNGGTFVTYAGYKRPDIFKYIINHSGGPIYKGHSAFGFQTEFDIITAGVGFGEEFRTKNLPIKVFSVVGTFEGEADIGLVERFHEDLKANNSITGEKYSFYPQGHTWMMWGDSFKEGILWLLYDKNIDYKINVEFNKCSMQSFISILEEEDVESRQVLIDRYFDEILQRETYPITDRDNVLFLYRGNEKEVKIGGDFSYIYFIGLDMVKVEGTDLFYKKIKLHPKTRLTYNYLCDNVWKEDRFNQNKSDVIESLNSGFETKVGNLLEMPYYNSLHKEFRVSIKHGHLIEYTINNPIELEEEIKERKYRVYLPYNYEEGKIYKIIYIISGSFYIEKGNIKNRLDNLIFGNKLEPVIAVFIDTVNREKDCIWESKEIFLKLVVDTIMQEVEEKYNFGVKNTERILLGSSDAGGFVLYAATKYPEYFQYIFNQSGIPMYKFDNIFEKNDTDVNNIYGESYGEHFKDRELNIKILSVYGIYENQRNKDSGIKLHRDLMQNISVKDQKLIFYPQGHNWTMWGDSFADGLLWLLYNNNTDIEAVRLENF